jgi:hypothetical protein
MPLCSHTPHSSSSASAVGCQHCWHEGETKFATTSDVFDKQQLQLKGMSACHNPDTCALQPEPEHSNDFHTVSVICNSNGEQPDIKKAAN